MLASNNMLTALEQAMSTICLPEKTTQERLFDCLKAKAFWEDLSQMFKNYFRGKKLYANVSTTKNNAKLLQATFEEFLSLYNLFSFGWADIERANIVLEVTEPGEALTYVLSEEAKLWLKPTETKPETLYRCWLAYTSGNPKAKVYEGRLRKQRKSPIANYFDFIDICLIIFKDSENPSVRDAAKAYREKRHLRYDLVNTRLRGLW